MGEHVKTYPAGRLSQALRYAWAHRRKIVATAIVALPLVARYVPDFPADTFVTLLRTYLGA